MSILGWLQKYGITLVDKVVEIVNPVEITETVDVTGDVTVTGDATVTGAFKVVGGATLDALTLGATAVTATGAELNKLEGAGDVVASGTPAENIAAAKTDYGEGDLDTEAEIIAALNTTNTKLNAVIAALEAFGIAASS